jgi:plastocyanin
MDGTVFYFVGGGLVLAALVLSYFGIKGKTSFPPNSRVLTGVMAAFGLLVAVTSAYAVANAREEQEHRNEEIAHEEAEAAEAEAEEAPPSPGGSPSGEPAESSDAAAPGGEPAPAGPQQALAVTSPEDGSLSFEPDSFQIAAGEITFVYDNPSPVPHNINVEDDEGQVLAESDDVTGEEAEVSAELVPGEYTFFCSIPGHREGGMEGVLTVE